MEGYAATPSSTTAFPELVAPGGEGPVATLFQARKTPKRSFFVLGALGHFIAAGIAMPLYVLVRFPWIGFFAAPFGFVLFGVITVIIWFGLFLQLMAMYGLWRNYSSKLAGATFWFGIASTLLFVVCLWFATYYGIMVYLGFGAYRLLLYLGSLAIGLTFILEGSAFFNHRDLAHPEIAIATAVFFIIAGLAFCLPPVSERYSGLFPFAGGMLAIPAFTFGGILLFGAPIEA